MYIIQVVLNNTRLCQGCIPGKDSHCGHGGQSIHSRGREGARMFCPEGKVVSAHRGTCERAGAMLDECAKQIQNTLNAVLIDVTQ